MAAELIIMRETYTNRLFWPYGDPVPGNFLAKLGLPVTLIFTSLATSSAGKKAVFAGAFALLTMSFGIFAGERINFLIRFCAGLLATVSFKPRFFNVSTLLAVQFGAIGLILTVSDSLRNKFVTNLLYEMPINFWSSVSTDSMFAKHSGYFKAMEPGFLSFNLHPILGIGPANYRLMCPEIVDKFRQTADLFAIPIHIILSFSF